MSENIRITYTQVPRFEPGSQAGVNYLDEHGFVVFANALSPVQADHALDLLWDYLEGLQTGIDRTDPDSWGDERWPTAVHGGILPSLGIGHSAAQWFMRDVDAVKDSFAAVWGTDDLLVSFDGVTVWRPWTRNPSWRTNAGPSWLHIDQHPIGRPGKHCVQGVLNLLPTSPATGGNVVVPGSQHRFEQIPELYTERLARIHPSIDHFRFPKDDPLLKDTQPIMCHMEAGDLLLWDSRTIHCSSPGLTTPDNDTDLLRAASLICMMPRAKSNAEVIAQRKAAVANMTSTTNWSDCFVDADQFPDVVNAPNRDSYKIPVAPALNSNQLKMVGWEDTELDAIN